MSIFGLFYEDKLTAEYVKCGKMRDAQIHYYGQLLYLLSKTEKKSFNIWYQAVKRIEYHLNPIHPISVDKPHSLLTG
jgi:hypothetical protein